MNHGRYDSLWNHLQSQPKHRRVQTVPTRTSAVGYKAARSALRPAFLTWQLAIAHVSAQVRPHASKHQMLIALGCCQMLITLGCCQMLIHSGCQRLRNALREQPAALPTDAYLEARIQMVQRIFTRSRMVPQTSVWQLSQEHGCKSLVRTVKHQNRVLALRCVNAWHQAVQHHHASAYRQAKPLKCVGCCSELVHVGRGLLPVGSVQAGALPPIVLLPINHFETAVFIECWIGAAPRCYTPQALCVTNELCSG